MAVYRRTYKIYQGALTPSWSRFAVLTRYSLSTMFDSKLFTVYTLVCLIPILAGIAQIYVTHSQTAQFLLNAHFGGHNFENNVWFELMLRIQTGLGFIMVAWAAPGLISRDFSNQALQLYFSRPLSRTEYILGKISVLAIVLSCITWIPLLLLFGVEAQVEGNGWGWNNFYLVWSIIVSGWLWIAVVSLLALAICVSVKWRIAATGLIIGIYFLLAGFGVAFNTVLGTHWGSLMNLPMVLFRVRAELFRLSPKILRLGQIDEIPLGAAWAMILITCVVSLMLFKWRLKAREVVRG